jgi:membrane protein DedA with SNARE-associated domain
VYWFLSCGAVLTVENTIQFLIDHGYAVLFAWVLLEQGGLPIPAVPFLLHLGLILGTALIASLLSDVSWYGLGRRRGMGILHLLCRISLEPDSCVRQTEHLFSRRGSSALLVAKFIPGLSTVAPPLAGITRMPVVRFILFDGLGALIWIGIFVALGVLFGEQLEGLAAMLATMGAWLLAILVGGLGAYLLWKFLARQLFLRRLRVARISPEELMQKLESREEVVIVDLRHPLDFDADPVVIPGAVRWDAGDLDQGRLTLPRDREVILYCS